MSLDFDITHAVFQISPIGMAFICASSGVVVKVNPAYCALLKRDEDQIVGKTWMLYTHPDDFIKSNQIYHSLKINKHTTIQQTKRYVQPDGNCIHAHETITSFQTDVNPQIYLVSVESRNWYELYKQELRNGTAHFTKQRDEVINALVLMANFRDRETGGHLRRTSLYVQLLLEQSRSMHAYSNYGVETIAKSSMLHDIGKVGISDSILHKKGFLSSEEFETMKTHTSLGALALTGIVNISSVSKYPEFIYATDFTAVTLHFLADGGNPSSVTVVTRTVL